MSWNTGRSIAANTAVSGDSFDKILNMPIPFHQTRTSYHLTNATCDEPFATLRHDPLFTTNPLEQFRQNWKSLHCLFFSQIIYLSLCLARQIFLSSIHRIFALKRPHFGCFRPVPVNSRSRHLSYARPHRIAYAVAPVRL